MKKILFISMISFVSLTQSQSWDYLGNAGFSGDTANYLSLAINSQSQEVYVAYQDLTYGGKLSLTKYQGNGIWGQSAEAPIPLLTGYSSGYANFIDLNIDDGGLAYICFVDAGNSDNIGLVSQISSGNFQSNYISGTNSSSVNTHIKKDFDNVRYFVHYNGRIKFSREAIETAITPEINITALSFDFLYGSGYIAYSNLDDGGKIDVQKVNTSESIDTYDNISDGLSNYIDLAISPLTLQPYIAFQDLANAGKVTVKKLNGDNWELVGDEAFSGGLSNYVDLAFDSNGVPYVAFQDVSFSNKLSVMSFNGTTWEYVGDRGITNSSASYCSIELNSDGEIFVAFKDGAVDNKASVMRYGSTLSLNENYLSDYSLYPNPTNNLLNVKSQGLLDIKIYDGLGHLVLKNDSSNSIDVSKLSSGLYFVNIKNGSKTSIKKFIKN